MKFCFAKHRRISPNFDDDWRRQNRSTKTAFCSVAFECQYVECAMQMRGAPSALRANFKYCFNVGSKVILRTIYTNTHLKYIYSYLHLYCKQKKTDQSGLTLNWRDRPIFMKIVTEFVFRASHDYWKCGLFLWCISTRFVKIFQTDCWHDK